jgi:hypothetical protein
MSRLLYIVLIAALIWLSGCGAEERQDATKSGQTVDKSAAEVIAFPNRFRNVAHKCDGHGHRVYSGSTGSSGTYAQLYVVADPSCPGGVEAKR